jgi:hypothetical protein
MAAYGRQRVCFFVGPSVPMSDFRAACAAIDATVLVLPPVQQGDLLRLLNQLPDVIGIIDGYFFQVPAVLHKEILLTMERGARVLGASSLGALRAAELDTLGMEGIGTIYRLYKRGVIDGDDEVAVLHTEAMDGFRPLTEPLVNIRHNLRRARARRLISSRTAAAVLASAKQLNFTQRTPGAVLDGARVDRVALDEVVALGRFWREQAVDLKREDALALVRTVADRIGGAEPWPTHCPVRVNRTTFVHVYFREYVGHTVAGQHVPEALVLAFQQLLSSSFPRLFRRVGLRCLAAEEAVRRGLVGSAGEGGLAEFRQRRKLEADEAYQGWLRQHYLSHEELVAGLRERDHEVRLLACYERLHPRLRDRAAQYRQLVADVAIRMGIDGRALTRPLLMRPGILWDGPLLRELKLRGAFRPALELAGRILQYNAAFSERNPWFSLSRIPRDRLDQWVATRWASTVDALSAAMLDRGFARDDEFVEVAQKAYVYEVFRQLPGGAV